MPIPFIVGAIAAASAIAGVGAGVKGAMKIKGANDTIKNAKARNDQNIKRFEELNQATTAEMDALGKEELEIIKSFQEFAETYEKIKNKPKFANINIGDTELPTYSPEDLKNASIGASVLLGGLGGAAVGTAGGFAAAGATTAAVMALGTASTGTAIASLSGVAATNATLAAIGGGSIAAGGGGMALGSALLSGATLGVGLLAAGIIFNFTGSKLEDKAAEVERQVDKAEAQINKICTFLSSLKNTATAYLGSLRKVNSIYKNRMGILYDVVQVQEKTDWNDFTDAEKKNTESVVRLVTLLYSMCKLQIVKKATEKEELDTVQILAADEKIRQADTLLNNL